MISLSLSYTHTPHTHTPHTHTTHTHTTHTHTTHTHHTHTHHTHTHAHTHTYTHTHHTHTTAVPFHNNKPHFIKNTNSKRKQDSTPTLQRNIEACSCNHFCSRKAIIITYSECVFVALVTPHAKHTRHIVICGTSGSTIFFFFLHIISLTERFSKSYWTQNVYFDIP